MELYEARNLLPRVGDKLRKIPANIHPPGCAVVAAEEEDCTVIEVNPAHLWYRVRFQNTGFIECYKVPRLRGYKEEFIE